MIDHVRIRTFQIQSNFIALNLKFFTFSVSELFGELAGLPIFYLVKFNLNQPIEVA